MTLDTCHQVLRIDHVNRDGLCELGLARQHVFGDAELLPDLTNKMFGLGELSRIDLHVAVGRRLCTRRY